MRPIRLTISGLHSFREPQEIRFDELAASGVFGIFGPTGSGKSSILDAITLALYGTVGRAEHNTRGILNHAEQQLSVSLTFEIGRGSSKTSYKVERSYKRKDELSVQNVRSRLIEERPDGAVVLADKDGEVTAEVKDILGLEPDDFTRAVVLPQGKFAEFLNLKGSERNRMLQRLFSLHAYGDVLTQRLKERADTTERQYQRIEALQQGLGDASPAALNVAKEALKTATQEEASAKEHVQGTRLRYDALKQIWALQGELAEVEETLQEHERSQNGIAQMKEILACAERAERVYPHLESYRRTQQEHAALLRQVNSYEQALTDITEELRRAEAAYRDAALRRKTEEPVYLERKARLDAAKGLESDVVALKTELMKLKSDYDEQMVQYKSWKQAAEANNEHIENSRLKLEQIQKEMMESTVSVDERAKMQLAYESAMSLERAREAFNREQERYQMRDSQSAELDQALKHAEEALSTVRVELAEASEMARGLSDFSPSKLDALKDLLGELDRISHLNGQWQMAAKRLDEAVSACNTTSVKLAEVESHVQELQTRHSEILAEYNQVRAAHQASLTQQHEMATALAARLLEGEPCPVCGSKHHPAPASELPLFAMQDDIQNLTQRLVALESSLESVTQECLAAEKTMYAHRADLDAARLSQSSREQDLSMVRQQVIQAMGSLNETFAIAKVGDETPETVERWLHEQNHRIQSERQTLLEGIQKHERATGRLTELERNVVRLEAEVEGLKAQVATAKEELKQAHLVWASAQRELTDIKVTFAAAVQQIDDASTPQDQRNEEWVEAVIRTRDERDARLQEARGLYEQCNQELQNYLRQKETLAAQLQDVGLSLASLKERHQSRKATLEEARQKLMDITGGQPIESVLAQLHQSVERLRQVEQDSDNKLRQTDAKRMELETERLRVQARLESVAVQRDANAALLEVKLKENGFVSQTEVERALLSAEERDSLREQARVFEERRLQLSMEKSRLQSVLRGESVSESEWKASQDALQTAEERWRQAIGSLDVAVKTLADMQTRHEQWKRMEAERAKLSEEISRLSTLKGLLSGNKFVEFLAQEQLDFVARQASERLQQLTRNRYGLEVAADGRFVMRDDHNGGVKRPVSTLSGGETFLTSLALALSLSTQIQLRGKYPLEFFFLDEGFGTLDPELLDVVMSTLEKLHLEQMSIGVISHVPELRARMQRRLIVEPAEPAGRGTRVRVELA